MNVTSKSIGLLSAVTVDEEWRRGVIAHVNEYDAEVELVGVGGTRNVALADTIYLEREFGKC